MLNSRAKKFLQISPISSRLSNVQHDVVPNVAQTWNISTELCWFHNFLILLSWTELEFRKLQLFLTCILRLILVIYNNIQILHNSRMILTYFSHLHKEVFSLYFDLPLLPSLKFFLVEKHFHQNLANAFQPSQSFL